MEFQTEKLQRVKTRVVEELRVTEPGVSERLALSEIMVNVPRAPGRNLLTVHIAKPLPNGGKSVSSEGVIFDNDWLEEAEEETIAAKLKTEFRQWCSRIR